MCGLIAMISRRTGGFWSKDLDTMEQLLLIDSLRGKDSTGAFTVYKNKQSEIIKVASHPMHLFACGAWGEFRNRAVQRGKIIVGHNRAATRGAVRTENAHPFVEDNIILVHNGTLYDHTNLTKAKVEVDSNAIAHALSGGADPKEVLPTIRGAFALIWYDTDKEKLYAIRNEQRPLCLLETDDNYVLSSEPLIAALPLDRNNYKVKNIHVLEPGELLEFDDKGHYSSSKVDLSKKATPVTHGTSGNTGTASNYSRATYGAANQRWDHLTNEEMEDDELGPFDSGTTEPVPPVILDLRKALADQAKTKGALARSNDCSLTQPKGGEVKKAGHTQSNVIEEIDKIADNNTKMIQVEHADVRRGQKVLFKITEFFKAENGRFRFRGKLHHPGTPLLDCVGVAPATFTPEGLARTFLGKLGVGFVHFITHTAGGYSVYIRNMDTPTVTQTHKQQRTPFMVWQHALAFCTCMKCGQKAKPWDKNFTSVSTMAVTTNNGAGTRNVVRMMCADCVEKVLKENEIEAFRKERAKVQKSVQQQHNSTSAGETETTPRDPSVQNWESVRKESSSGDGKSIEVPGTKTLQ